MKRVLPTNTDRRLIVWLASCLNRWREALLIVKPDTILMWHRTLYRLFWRQKSQAGVGRPHLANETIVLIKQMAADNRLWGAERIQGELLKLGIKVSKRTIQKYMRRQDPVGLRVKLGRLFYTIMPINCGLVTSCPSWICSFGSATPSSSLMSDPDGWCMSVSQTHRLTHGWLNSCGRQPHLAVVLAISYETTTPNMAAGLLRSRRVAVSRS